MRIVSIPYDGPRIAEIEMHPTIQTMAKANRNHRILQNPSACLMEMSTELFWQNSEINLFHRHDTDRQLEWKWHNHCCDYNCNKSESIVTSIAKQNASITDTAKFRSATNSLEK